MSDLVSVIVPVWNSRDSLATCVESILGQTYRDLEIILIDDGSTDGSAELCHHFATKYQNIRSTRIDNSGQGVARNVGLDMATGKYVTFADADDYMDKDVVYDLVAGMTEDVDCVIGGYRRIQDGATTYVECYDNRVHRKPSEDLLYYVQGLNPNTRTQVKGTVWGSLYRMSVVRENQIRFESERAVFSEDTAFNVDFLRCCGGARTISNAGYCYVQNMESTTHRYDRNKLDRVISYYEYMLAKLGPDDPEVVIRNQSFFVFNLIKCFNQVPVDRGPGGWLGVYSEVRSLVSRRDAQEIVSSYPARLLPWKVSLPLVLFRYRLALTLTLLIVVRRGWSQLKR